jgi:hypothetical protein
MLCTHSTILVISSYPLHGTPYITMESVVHISPGVAPMSLPSGNTLLHSMVSFLKAATDVVPRK